MEEHVVIRSLFKSREKLVVKESDVFVCVTLGVKALCDLSRISKILGEIRKRTMLAIMRLSVLLTAIGRWLLGRRVSSFGRKKRLQKLKDLLVLEPADR